MKKVIPVLAGVLFLLAACAPALATPPATPTPPMVQVVVIPQTAAASPTPQIWTPTSAPEYVRPPAEVGNAPCVLTGEYACVIFFTDTGEAWGALLARAEREMVLGTDLPANTVAALIFDKNDTRMPRNELVQVLAKPEEETQLKVDNGGLLISIDDWSAYHVELGAPFEDGIFAMREASLDLLADSVLDNRALSDAGQLCFESGKEISRLFPCHREAATMIPSPTSRP